MRPALPSGRTNPRWTARQKLQSNAAQLKKNQLSPNRETKARVIRSQTAADQTTADKTAPRRSLHAGKVPNGVCLGKPVAPLTVRRHLPEMLLYLVKLVFWSWRRESNPRPSDYKSDALPTELRQQTLGKMRFRANLSLGSLPDVRDN